MAAFGNSRRCLSVDASVGLCVCTLPIVEKISIESRPTGCVIQSYAVRVAPSVWETKYCVSERDHIYSN